MFSELDTRACACVHTVFNGGAVSQKSLFAHSRGAMGGDFW